MRPAMFDEMSWEMGEVYEAVHYRLLENLAKYFPYINQDDQARDLFTYQARMLAQIGQVNRESVDIIMAGLDGGDDARVPAARTRTRARGEAFFRSGAGNRARNRNRA